MKAPVYVSLQYTRGIAALAVVYFHAVLASVNAFAGRDAPLPWIGAFGVDLFFVLSGFVMWTSTAGQPVSIAQFYKRRIIRIVPFYWLMTTVLLTMTLIMPGAAKTTVVKPVHVLTSYLFMPWPNPGMAGRPVSDLMTPLLVPGWTLNYEMFFYLLFGLTLMLNGAWRFWVLLLSIPLVMVACILLSPYSLMLNFYGSLRLLEFAGGVVLGRITLAKAGQSIATPVAVCTMIAGGLALPIIEAAQWPKHVAWLTLASLATTWAVIAIEQRGYMPNNRLFRLLGDASFSIYLTHIFTITGLRIVVLRLLSHGAIEVSGSLQIVFVFSAIVASIIVGVISHFAIERPLTRRLLVYLKPAAKSSIDMPVSIRN